VSEVAVLKMLNVVGYWALLGIGHDAHLAATLKVLLLVHPSGARTATHDTRRGAAPKTFVAHLSRTIKTRMPARLVARTIINNKTFRYLQAEHSFRMIVSSSQARCRRQEVHVTLRGVRLPWLPEHLTDSSYSDLDDHTFAGVREAA
jgi:hypothetical protein